MTPEALIIESMFNIANKDGEDVPFLLNTTQKKLDNNLTGRDLIPKARQEGISSYYLARYTAACMMKRNTRAVIVSHEQKSTERMLARVKYFVDTLRGPAPVIQTMSKYEIGFSKTNSMFYIGTAGSRKFGRGDTITHLHCSEYAYWPDSKELMAGLLQAVPMSGEIGIESTGNGVGNDYHSRCMRANAGKGTFSLHFFNWIDFPEYTMELTDEEAGWLMKNLKEEWEEDKLVDILTPGQFAFRRLKLDEFDYDLGRFKQEYPLTLDECFLASGRSIFHKINMVPTRDWIKESRELYKLKDHPKVPSGAHQGRVYSVGADVGGGIGRDRSTIEVIDVEANEQVAEWTSDTVPPDIFANKIAAIATLFNEAFVTVENNNHGIVTLSVLRDIYPNYLIYESETGPTEDDHLLRLGFRTSKRSKPLMIGRLRLELAGSLVIHSSDLKGELDSFIEHEDGTLGAQDGCFDDRVIGIAMGVMGLERAGLYALRPSGHEGDSDRSHDPFTLDGIIDEMHGKKGKYPIAPQHGSKVTSVADSVKF